MFLTHRFNPFEEFERTFDSLFDYEDGFSNFFQPSRPLNQRKLSKEELLKRNLNNILDQENQLNHYIKQYESHLEQLKKDKEIIEKKKTKITDKISKIIEEKKKIENTSSNSSIKNPSNENRVFKKIHYISDGMEIEEQYDSTNPKNCFKIIRKQGEAPQVISTEQQDKQLEQDKNNKQQQQTQTEKLGDGIDEKLEQLCQMTGKNQDELKSFVIENKELTIGQLYDKTFEQKLI